MTYYCCVKEKVDRSKVQTERVRRACDLIPASAFTYRNSTIYSDSKPRCLLRGSLSMSLSLSKLSQLRIVECTDTTIHTLIMSFLWRFLTSLLLVTAVIQALVAPTVPVTVYVTTTTYGIQPRQVKEASVPTSSAGNPGVSTKTGSVASTTVITTTMRNTTKVVTGLNTTLPGQQTIWLTTNIITSTSNSLSWSTCDTSEVCTGANATTNTNGVLVIPVPIPVIVIVQQVVPEVPSIPSISIPSISITVSDKKTSQSVPSSKSSFSFSFSSTSSSKGSSSTSFSSTSSSTSTITTSHTSSSTTITSSVSANSTSSADESCPTGVGLLLDDDEGISPIIIYDYSSLNCFCRRQSKRLLSSRAVKA